MFIDDDADANCKCLDLLVNTAQHLDSRMPCNLHLQAKRLAFIIHHHSLFSQMFGSVEMLNHAGARGIAADLCSAWCSAFVIREYSSKGFVLLRSLVVRL
jgi:hypothetical protein